MFQISQNIAHPGRTENSTPGPMSVLPRQVNQRPHRRAVENIRGGGGRMPSGAPSRSSVQRGGRRAAGRLGISAAYRTVGCENQTSATMLMHQGGAPHAPLLSRTTCLSPQGVRFTQHARGAFQDFSPSTCTHQYHHCIIHTHHSCILLATSFTHNTLLLTWPRSTERRGCSLYPGARVEF